MRIRILPGLIAAFGAACTTAGTARAPMSGANEAGSGARYDIAYRIAFPVPASHLYEISVEIAGIDTDTLRLQLPVWSPGRYARMDFARNVQNMVVTTPEGAPLRWAKEEGSRWRIDGTRGGRVKVSYKVFANNLSGTFSVLDTAHANWNGAGLFLYAVGHKPDPVRLLIVPPEGWRIMSGAVERDDQREFRFANYDILIDTPTEVAPAFDVDSFRVDGILYRVVVHTNGGSAAQNGQRTRFVRDVRRLVERQNKVVAAPPIQHYTFLFNIGYAGGDGMEHLNSTEIINSGQWTDTAVVLPGMSTASHEYFHTWNVKRIRPAALGPFDYAREQFQPSLWVAEGWTQYYGWMTLHRAGVGDKDLLYRTLAIAISQTSQGPARLERSARAASFDAPFFDGAASPMRTNAGETFVSYYTRGAVLALALDLRIRAATGGVRSLDDVLRLVKQRTWDLPAASYYLQGRGYTEEDIERAAGDVFGANLHDWFERHVGGVEDLPWDEYLALAGLRLEPRTTGSTEFVIRERPDANAAQIKVREGWLAGAQ